MLLGGLIWRIRTWLDGPIPRLALTLFPASPGGLGLGKGLVKEILFFRSLFRGDRALWTGTWVFHATLLLILLGHFRLVRDVPALWRALRLNDGQVDLFSAAVGGAAGLVLLVAGLFLLARRLLLTRVREVSRAEDFAVLALLLAVILTGDYLRFFAHFDLGQSRAYFVSLIRFAPAAGPSQPLFLVHFTLAQTLLMVVPFSKFLHIPGVFFARPLLQMTAKESVA